MGKWSTKKLKAIHEKSCGRCGICRKRLKLSGYAKKVWEVDHIVPVSVGGKDGLSNLQVACRHCNRSRQAMPLKEAKKRIGRPRRRARQKAMAKKIGWTVLGALSFV